MLATASLGAVWSSCSPDFGDAGVIDRFGQIEPRVLFVCDGYRWKGRVVETLPRLPALREGLPSVEQVVVISQVGLPLPDGTDEFADFGPADPPPLAFVRLPFDHPVYILFSSGTTGKPKCIVHGAGGTLLQHLKELILHTDLAVGERLLYYTTCGWMMWNWMASGLAAGATLVLYDGGPFHPSPAALFDLVEREGVNVLGTSAKYIAALEKAGVRPRETHDLEALRAILSTGSPLAPESFDFVYHEVKPAVQLASISGGTDIVSCFALGCPIVPVYRGELQCAGLGMAIDVFDPDGNPVTGVKGELVCRQPFPSMPVGFWNDPDGSRYRAAYFERFPGVWAHGDFAELTPHGGLVIHGRSDAVLNPGGVRIGTAEIYRQVEKLDDVLESLAVGQRQGDDERILLFVVLRDGLNLDEALRERIRHVIRENTTPRHVPAEIFQVAEIPRTRSGKMVELAVRAVLHGEPVNNVEALANPEALEQFARLRENEFEG
jgi:acetoacetyl-CoA synthetase